MFSNNSKLRNSNDDWSQEEDEQLIKLIKLYGNKWAFLSKKILTKTSHQIRYRYNSVLKHKIGKENEPIIMKPNSNSIKIKKETIKPRNCIL